MSEWVKLTAQDGHELEAYVARPVGEALGALVLVQEIYGINEHIQSVADGYAKEGYLVVAPALFDRFERGLKLDYSPEGSKKAFELYAKLQQDWTLMDVGAAFVHAREAGKSVGILGFCYGGLTAWWSATRGETYEIVPACAVGYYAGGIGNFATDEPTCPVMLHFGAEDDHIGTDQVDAVKTAHPEVQVFVYEGAGHAFNRDADPSKYNAAAAKLARERTLTFLKTHLA